MEGHIFTRASEALKLVKSEEGNVLTKPFLDLCRILLPLIDNFGTSMICVRNDVSSNIVKLETKYVSDPTKYSDLYTITKEEVQSKVARSTSSCTTAFVWLNRAMDFMVQLFNNLLENAEWTLTQAITDSYKRTLKKWHGWMAFSTFKVLIKFTPDRKKFLESIGWSSEVQAEIDKLCKAFAPMLEDNHTFLASVGVDDLRVP